MRRWLIAKRNTSGGEIWKSWLRKFESLNDYWRHQYLEIVINVALVVLQTVRNFVWRLIREAIMMMVSMVVLLWLVLTTCFLGWFGIFLLIFVVLLGGLLIFLLILLRLFLLAF